VKLICEIDSFPEPPFPATWNADVSGQSALFFRLTTDGSRLVLYVYLCDLKKQTDNIFSFVLAHVFAVGSLTFFFLLPSPLGPAIGFVEVDLYSQLVFL
jgi:hypothetical protein